MRICENWSTDPPRLDFECPSTHCERPRPITAPFEPLKLLNPELNPASENNANPCGSGSALLLSSIMKLVLRIRIVYRGSLIRIFPSRIPDSNTVSIKEFKSF
jgi:hypothetical protein